MKYYLISVTEYRFGIVPMAASENLRITDFDFEPIFLLPSVKSDFEIKLREDKISDGFYKILAFEALKNYFFKVRGLPLEEIEISHSVSNYTLKNTDKILVKPQECKYKFSKRRLEISGAVLEYFAASNVMIFSSKNVSEFDENALSYALLKENEPCSSAVAYSRDENAVHIKRCGKISSLECALMLAELLISEGSFGKNEIIDFLFDFGQKISLKNLGNSIFEATVESEFLGVFD